MNAPAAALRAQACVQCGQVFTLRSRADRRYCDGACRQAALEARRRLPPPAPSLEERAADARVVVQRLEAELFARRAELRALEAELALELAGRQVSLLVEETRSQRINRLFGVAVRDLWRTPPEVFAFLRRKYPHIPWLLDAAALPDDSLCPAHIGPRLGGLVVGWSLWARLEAKRQGVSSLDWPGVWCNPPYSPGAGGISAWVEKAIAERDEGVCVAMLLPADTSTAWYRRAHETATSIYLLPRLAHLHPDTGAPVKGSRFGSALIVWADGVGAEVHPVMNLG